MENDKDVELLGSAVPGDSGVARHADQFAQIADALCDRIELEAMSHSGDIEDEGRQLVEDALRAAVAPYAAIVTDLAACDPISNDCSSWCQLCETGESASVYEPEQVVHTDNCPWARAKTLTTR
jgi:hypothetical protein